MINGILALQVYLLWTFSSPHCWWTRSSMGNSSSTDLSQRHCLSSQPCSVPTSMMTRFWCLLVNVWCLTKFHIGSRVRRDDLQCIRRRTPWPRWQEPQSTQWIWRSAWCLILGSKCCKVVDEILLILMKWWLVVCDEGFYYANKREMHQVKKTASSNILLLGILGVLLRRKKSRCEGLSR